MPKEAMEIRGPMVAIFRPLKFASDIEFKLAVPWLNKPKIVKLCLP